MFAKQAGTHINVSIADRIYVVNLSVGYFCVRAFFFFLLDIILIWNESEEERKKERRNTKINKREKENYVHLFRTSKCISCYIYV